MTAREIQRHLKRRSYALAQIAGLLTISALALVACGDASKAVRKPLTPVRVQAARTSSFASEVMLTGHIAPRVQSQLGFRIEGRIASRHMDVGDHVENGAILATLETVRQEADVSAAQAGVASAEAALREADATYERQKTLMAQRFTTQLNYDRAKQAFDSAVAGLDGAKAALATAEDALANTRLRADAAGIITARNAEVGQFVAVGQSVYTIAQDGPRDAVIEVFEALLASPPQGKPIELTLLSNPSIRTRGIVREVAPTVDAGSGTVRVKIGVDHPPAEMGLGAAVSGTGRFSLREMILLPWTAFFADSGATAVWVVDPQSHAASLRNVEVYRYRTGEVVVSDGLKAGELVVTHGGQLLRPGEIVDPQLESSNEGSGGRS